MTVKQHHESQLPFAVDQGSPTPALSPHLGHVANAIESSRAMLELPDDWDGQGSPAYDEATWQRAADFLTTNAHCLLDEYGIAVEALKVRKGPLGSIDLHWRTPAPELLVNVPVAADEPIDFYGDDRHGGHHVKGALDLAEVNHWLLMWLVE